MIHKAKINWALGSVSPRVLLIIGTEQTSGQSVCFFFYSVGFQLIVAVRTDRRKFLKGNTKPVWPGNGQSSP